MTFAKISAFNELIERDAFLRHWMTKIPFIAYKMKNVKNQSSFEKSLLENNHKLYLYKTFLGVKPSVLAVILNQKTKGFLIGSSCHENLEKAAFKAISEAFFSLTATAKKNNSYYSGLNKHRRYWYETNEIPSWFFKENLNEKNVRKRISTIIPTFKVLSHSPVPVVAAFAPPLLDLWVGNTPNIVFDYIKNTYNVIPNREIHPFP